MKPQSEIHVLLVEDNEGDIILTTEAFKEGPLINKLSIARDGEEALDFLYQQNQFHAAKRPDLILLDTNLPKIDGKEVLNEIKRNQHLLTIPVGMPTTSSAEADIKDFYKNNANCYIIKPVDLHKFLSATGTIQEFWISVVKLPINI